MCREKEILMLISTPIRIQRLHLALCVNFGVNSILANENRENTVDRVEGFQVEHN